MQRDEAIQLYGKFLKRFMQCSFQPLVKSLYIFGSFSKGSPKPNDIDLLLVLATDKEIRRTKYGATIKRRFLGGLQDIDLLVCNEHEFEKFEGYTFFKADLILLWPHTNPDWKEVLESLCPVNADYHQDKVFQYKLFDADYPMKRKFQAAVKRDIIRVKELPAEGFYHDQGPWDIEYWGFDSSGKEIREVVVNEYDEFLTHLDYHTKRNVSPQYLKTLKVLYSYANRNEIYLEEDIMAEKRMHRPYETFFQSDDETIILRVYIVHLRMCLYHLNYAPSIEKVILIPRYRVRSRNNYLYEIERGANWSPEALKSLDEVYDKAFRSSFQEDVVADLTIL